MVAIAVDQGGDLPNDPRSIRIAAIAFVITNVALGSVFGSAGVLLAPMTQRLGVSTEMVAAGVLAALVLSGVCAPPIGALAAKMPLGRLAAVAAVLLSAAWLLLAFTDSYVLFLVAYGLLIGPALAVCAHVVPPTLITRWFNRHRGLALGVINLPILAAALPLVCEWLVQQFGLQTTLIVLGILPIATMLPAAFFIIDQPPQPVIGEGEKQPSPPVASLHAADLLRRPRFWALALSSGIIHASVIMLSLHLISMARSWDIAPLAAAGLASIMASAGMAGALALGMVSDKMGGTRTLAVIAAVNTVLWLLLLAELPYAGLAVVAGLIGLFSAGAVPSMGKALAENFGAASFSRAIGMAVPVGLPIIALGLIGPGAVARIYNSYTLVILVAAAAFAASAVMSFLVSRRSVT